MLFDANAPGTAEQRVHVQIGLLVQRLAELEFDPDRLLGINDYELRVAARQELLAAVMAGVSDGADPARLFPGLSDQLGLLVADAMHLGMLRVIGDLHAAVA
ncbi:hypothetical protein D5S17_36185 [Pseudonocardiaceae bacterium YIM PH 21723]|nr:hypothetical protein D5S17_36185 [Pseudonocardiaceae bacterium YIM PH 21723]